MSKPNKQKVVRNPKELSSQPEVAAIKTIAHAEVLQDDYSMDQYALAVEGFVEKAKMVTRQYEENVRIIARAELETLDLLHEIHLLPKANAVEGYRYYNRLREVQLARRKAKHENTLMKPLYDYVQQRPGIISELSHLKNILVDAENKVDGYTYKYRIQE